MLEKQIELIQSEKTISFLIIHWPSQHHHNSDVDESGNHWSSFTRTCETRWPSVVTNIHNIHRAGDSATLAVRYYQLTTDGSTLSAPVRTRLRCIHHKHACYTQVRRVLLMMNWFDQWSPLPRHHSYTINALGGTDISNSYFHMLAQVA